MPRLRKEEKEMDGRKGGGLLRAGLAGKEGIPLLGPLGPNPFPRPFGPEALADLGGKEGPALDLFDRSPKEELGDLASPEGSTFSLPKLVSVIGVSAPLWWTRHMLEMGKIRMILESALFSP